MALNKIFVETKEKNREAPVPAGTQAGVPLLIGSKPAVTLTAEPTATKQTTLSDGTVITSKVGGVGNQAGYASVAFDGTFEFAVTGALTTTASLVEVFITSGDVLTLTSSGNTHYGWTDYPRDYRKEAGRAAVRVGA